MSALSWTEVVVVCFQSQWRERASYGDYNADGKWNINDFLAFHADFRRGCP